MSKASVVKANLTQELAFLLKNAAADHTSEDTLSRFVLGIFHFVCLPSLTYRHLSDGAFRWLTKVVLSLRSSTDASVFWLWYSRAVRKFSVLLAPITNFQNLHHKTGGSSYHSAWMIGFVDTARRHCRRLFIVKYFMITFIKYIFQWAGAVTMLHNRGSFHTWSEESVLRKKASQCEVSGTGLFWTKIMA